MKYQLMFFSLMILNVASVSCSKKCDTGESISGSWPSQKCVSSSSPDNSPTGPTLAVVSSAVGNPRGIVADSSNAIFVADLSDDTIKKIGNDGTATVFAHVPGVYMLSIDSHDNIYNAPWIGGPISKIDSGGVITTFGSIDSEPTGLAIGPDGSVYYSAEPSNNSTNVIKKVTTAGMSSVFAGSGSLGLMNGNGTLASFNDPHGLVFDQSGNLFVVDAGNSVIRKITPSGVVTTFSGSGIKGVVDGDSATAQFSFRATGAQPTGIGISSTGNLYVGQGYGAGYLRAIDTSGSVSTYCGNGSDNMSPGLCSDTGFYQAGTVFLMSDNSILLVGPMANGQSGIIKISHAR